MNKPVKGSATYWDDWDLNFSHLLLKALTCDSDSERELDMDYDDAKVQGTDKKVLKNVPAKEAKMLEAETVEGKPKERKLMDGKPNEEKTVEGQAVEGNVEESGEPNPTIENGHPKEHQLVADNEDGKPSRIRPRA